jgi:hypothetical protein
MALTELTKDGLVPIRLTTIQRNAIVGPVLSQLIFNTTTNRYEYYNGTIWVGLAIPSQISTNTGFSNTVVNSIAEENLFDFGNTLLIPANTLAIGTQIKVTAWLTFGHQAVSPTLTMRLKSGIINPVTLLSAGTTLQTDAHTFLAGVQTGEGMKIEALIRIYAIGVGGALIALMELNMDGTEAAPSVQEIILGDINPATLIVINTTVDNLIYLSAQWGTAAVPNTINIQNIIFETIQAS